MPGTHLQRSRRRVDTAISSSQGLSKVFDGRQIFLDASQTQRIGSKPPYAQIPLFTVAIKPPAPGYEDHAIEDNPSRRRHKVATSTFASERHPKAGYALLVL